MADGRISRRSFVKGAGVAAGAAAVLDLTRDATAALAGAPKLGPGAVPVELTVNGIRHTVKVEPRTTLAETLREGLGLTGTKIGCDRGACGACTVMLGNKAVCACMTFALDATGENVTTIEGLSPEAALSPLQASFVAHDALQCGFCTPGMVMSCQALLAGTPHPTEDDVRQAVSGNLCRCGTYPRVFDATRGAPLPAFAAQPLHASAPLATPGELAVGVLDHVRPEKRAVPADDPKPWDAEARLSVVGTPVPRIDGAEKVTGRAQYAFDIRLPGMLYAVEVRSPHPHARVRAVDLSEARRMPGVRAACAVERILGAAKPRTPPSTKEPFPRVRYVGQPVAAVAAASLPQAIEAARRVKVDYEVLAHVADLDTALQPGSPVVYDAPVEQPRTAGGGGAATGLPQNGNIRGPLVSNTPEKADVEAALGRSEVKLEAHYRTEVQTHQAMETHGLVADWKPDGLTVYASTQGIFTVQDELATLFELPKSKVRVHSNYTGGGFGAKFGAGNYGAIAAILSKQAKAPVRLFMDRRGEHERVGNRPSSLQHLRVGAAKDGKLTALHLVALGTAGCAAGAGCAGPVKNLYPADVVRTEESDVFIHAGPSAAFRAPGHPQGAFGLEQAMDELAEKLGVDPLVLRDRNDAHPARREERRLGAAKIGWAAARATKPGGRPGPVKRGVGFAQGLWYNFEGPRASAEVLVHDDGSLECRTGVADIGGGVRTAIAQVVAEVFACAPADVHVTIGDTALPEGPASGGSMTTQMITPAVRGAAEKARQALREKVPGESDWRAAARKAGTVRGHAERSHDYEGWKTDPYTTTIGGAQFAEVEVDTETGIVRVLRVVAVHDCGRAVNRLATESQVVGGVIQGVSFALHERRILDRASGVVLNADLEHYQIAGGKDVPRIEAVVIDNHYGRTSVDASGIGEPSTVPTSAAIANAVYHATGKRIRALPITPRRVLEALGGAA
jgi:xanthine dehydrogenase YagR molybdenum-binding subunit